MAHYRKRLLFDEWNEQLDVITPIKNAIRHYWKAAMRIFGFDV